MIFRGVPLPSIFFFLPVGTLDLLFGGGGGGGGGAYFVWRLCFYDVLFIAVLVSLFWF